MQSKAKLTIEVAELLKKIHFFTDIPFILLFISLSGNCRCVIVNIPEKQ